MGTDDPSSVGLAEKNQKPGKPACRVFVFVLPHSRRECFRAHPFLSSEDTESTEDWQYRQHDFLKFCYFCLKNRRNHEQ